MDLNEVLNEYKLVGVIGKYEHNKLECEYVKDIEVKNIEKALIMVGLNNSYLNKKIIELNLSEELKIDLVTKLHKDIIIIGNLSQRLCSKDIDYLKKLFLKLCNDYNKKIVIIDEDINIFFNVTKYICVLKDKNIIYSTNNFFDQELYKYAKMPKIIDFIKYVNKDGKKVNETIEIYELIKDIYRSVS